MSVAIIGCGLSGMAAAYFLQRRGIKADVFEASDAISDFPTRVEALMPVYSKPVDDIPGYIRKNYRLDLKYHAPLNRIVWHTANASASAVGRLGVLTLRGRDKASLDQQLASRLTNKINFGASRSVEDLAEYKWVIDASGQSHPDRPGARSIRFRGGTIRGRFQPNTMHIWHTSAATPKGYAYLLPQSSTLANVFIVIPLAKEKSSDGYFSGLWPLLQRDLGFEPDLVRGEEFRRLLSNHLPGSTDVLHVGNSMGTAAPYLGIDQFFALSTSFFAAGEIAGGSRFLGREALAAHLSTMRVIGRAMDTWGDLVYDNLVRAMRMGATPFFVSKRNLLWAVSILLRPYASLVGKEK